MIIPLNNKVLLDVEKSGDTEDKGGFVVVKTKKEGLLKGVVVEGYGYTPGTVVYFSPYGSEEIEGKVIVELDQIWAYESKTNTEDTGE